MLDSSRALVGLKLAPVQTVDPCELSTYFKDLPWTARRPSMHSQMPDGATSYARLSKR